MNNLNKEIKVDTVLNGGPARISSKKWSSLFQYLKKNDSSSLYRPMKDIILKADPEFQKQVFRDLGLQTQGLKETIASFISSTKVGGLYSTMTSTMSNAQSSVADFKVAVDNIKEKMPSYFEKVEGILTSLRLFTDARSFILYLLDVTTFFLCLYYSVEPLLMAAAGAKILILHMSPHAKMLVDSAIKWGSKMTSDSFVVQSKTDSITGFIEFARSMIGIQTVDDKECITIIQKMRSQIGLLKDMKYVWSIMTGVFASVMWYFRPDLYTDKTENLLHDWELFSIELNKPDFEKKYGTDPTFASKMRKHFEQIIHMRKFFMDADAGTRERYKMVSHSFGIAMTLVTALENSFKNRIKPVVVHLHGGAGTGKSTLVSYLADELHRILNNVDDETMLNPTQVLYSININEKFRDSYNCQTIWYYDDPNQNKDVDILMDFFTELIQVGNDIPYKLDCSSIEGKAGTYFASPFAMFTTNGSLDTTLNIVSSKLQCREAVERRITFEVEVKVNEGFVGKDRYSLLVRAAGSKTFDQMDYSSFLKLLLKAYAVNVNDKKIITSKQGTSQEMRDFYKLQTQGYKSYYYNKAAHLVKGTPQAKVRGDIIAKYARHTKPNLAVPNSAWENEFYNHIFDPNVFADSHDFYDWQFSRNPRAQSDPNRILREITVYYLPFVYQNGAGAVTEPGGMYYVYPGPNCHPGIGDQLMDVAHRGGQHVVTPDNWGRYIWGSWTPLIDKCCGQYYDMNTSTSYTHLALAQLNVQRAQTAVVSGASNFWNFIQPVLVIFGQILALQTMIVGVSMLITYLITPATKEKKKRAPVEQFREDDSTQVDYPKDISGPSKAKLNPVIPRKLKMDKPQGENEKDVITRNVRHVSWADSIQDDCTASVKGLFIKEGFILMPKHFFYSRKKEKKFLRIIRYQEKVGVLIPFDFVMENSVCLGDEDLVLLDCKNYCQGRDITSHMLTDREVSTLLESQLELRLPSFEKEPKIVSAKAIFSRVPLTYYDEDDVEFQLSTSFRFKYATAKGACGSPYLLEDSKFKGCLVGVHVAGDGNTGVGCMFTKDMFFKSLNAMKMHPQCNTGDILNNPPAEKQPRLIIPKKAKFIKVVDPKDSAYIPNRTQIEINYEWFGFLTGYFEIPDNRVPAPLAPFVHEGNVVNPLQVAVTKIGDEITEISDEHLKIFQEVADEYVKTWPNGTRLTRMTEKEVLNGIPGTSFKAINMRKSAGINYLGSKLRGKFTYVVCDTCNEGEKCECKIKNWSLTPESRKTIDGIREKIFRKEKVPIVYQGCLKDELRDVLKALAGKARLFSVGSFELLYLVREFLGHYMEVFISDPMAFCSGIGINPHSTQWRILFEYLRVFKKVVAADAEGWDYSIGIQLLRIVLPCYNKWYERIAQNFERNGHPYDKEQFLLDQNARAMLGEMSHSAYLLIGDHLVFMELVFSGHPMTGITNTVVNNIVTRAAIVSHFAGTNITSPSKVFSQVHLTATGDDIVMTHGLPYTCFDHAKSMKNFGIKLTPFDKVGEFKDSYVLSEVDYLKRKFEQREGMVFAPLVKSSLLGSINWKHKGMANRTAARANLECMFVEAMHHGKEFYEELRIVASDKYADLYRDVGDAIIPTIDYEDMVAKMQEGSLNVEFVTQSGEEPVPVSKIHNAISEQVGKPNVGSAMKTKHKGQNKTAKKHQKMIGKSSGNAMVPTFGPNSGPSQGGMRNVRRRVLPDGKQYIVTFDPKTHKEVLVYEKTISEQPLFQPRPKPKSVEKPTKKEITPNYSMHSDREIIDDMFSEPKARKNPFLKDAETIKEEKLKMERTLLKNKESKDLEAINKISNLRFEDDDEFADHSEPNIDLEESECDPISEFRTQKPLQEEFVTKQTNPNMNTQTRKLVGQNGSLSMKKIEKPTTAPQVKERLKTNLKRIFRPRVDGDIQATNLIRFLGIDSLRLEEMKEKYNMTHYRSDKAFKNTNLHFSYNNLVHVCKTYKLRFVSEPIVVPETTIPGLKVTVSGKGGEIAFACGFDLDQKNTAKFAYWNTIVELSFKGYDCGTFTQSTTGEKLPIPEVTEMTSKNSKIQEELPSVESTSVQAPTDLIRGQDPYPDMTPKDLLERQLLIASFPITSTEGLYSNIVELSMPGSFTAIPFWNDLLARFNRCIFDIEIESRISANMMQQGLFLWSYTPGVLQSDKRAQSTFTSPMQILQDVTTCPTIKFTIRGITYKHGFDQRLVTEPQLRVGGTIKCTLMSQIRESNSTAPLSVLMTVYAKMINVRGFGFRTQSSLTKEVMPKHLKEMAIPAEGKIKESVAKSKGGISAALDTVSAVSGMMSIIPQAAPMASSISALSGLAANVGRYFGMSNSRDVSSNAPALPRSVPTLSLNHGVIQTDVHALAVDSMISSDKTAVSDEIDYNIYDNFKLRPSLSGRITITPETPVGLISNFSVAPQNDYLPIGGFDYQSASKILADMHHFWRGGMKYKFIVVCNRFVAFRLRVYWRPNGSESISPTVINVSNFANRIINVTGPTTFELTIPYLALEPTLLTSGTLAQSTNGNLAIELLTPIQVQGTVAVPVDILIWSSCAEDMIFAKQKPLNRLVVQSGMEGNDLCASFRTVFDPIIDAQTAIIDKVTISDVASSFTERYSKPFKWREAVVTSHSGPGPATPTYIDLRELVVSTTNNELNVINTLFSAHRGSYNLIFIPRTASNFRFVAKSIVGHSNSSDGPFGIEPSSFGDHQNRQVISMTLPHYGTTYYAQPHFGDSRPPFYGVELYCFADSGSAEVVVDVLIALGEDFSLGHATALFAYTGL